MEGTQMSAEVLQQLYQNDMQQHLSPEMQQMQWQQMQMQQMQMQGQGQEAEHEGYEGYSQAQAQGGEYRPEEEDEPQGEPRYTPRFYYLLEKRQRLPAWMARQEFLKLMQSNQVLVLVGEPGSGKTTQLPQILLDAGYHVQMGQVRAICCAQPSPLATLSASLRICEELEVQLGTFVGHVTRFEDRTSGDTLLRFLTDEALLRESLEDPLLERYSVIILDEVHQRTCETDLLMGILKMVMQRRPELKLLLLSSSMDVKKVQDYFEGGAPLLQVPNRTYSVEVFHCQDSEKDYLKAAVRTVAQIHTTEPEGDILVFLPLEEEIDLACQLLRKESVHMMNFGELQVRALYIGLPILETQRAFEQTAQLKMGGKPCRKVVVASNVAETSLAVDGIIYVIDAGLVKQRAYNPRTRMEVNLVMPVSKTSALQRTSLAGRARPGKCFRLYPEQANGDWHEKVHPEIMRSNLTTVVLMLKRLGFDDVVHFDFVDPPSPEALMRALESLNHLGCIDDNGNITEVGNQACRLPLDPQIAKMLIEAPRHRCSNEALSIAAMLCSLPVWLRPNDAFRAANEAKARFAHMDGDHLTLLNVFHAYKQQIQDGHDPSRFCAENFISIRAMRHAEVARDHLKRIMESIGLQMISTDFQDKEYYPNIRRCLVSGFFMQIACLESEKRGAYSMLREGQEVLLHPSTSLGHKPEWIVFHELALSSKLFIKTGTQIKPEWLLDVAPRGYFDPQKISEKSSARSKLERLSARRQDG
ncbi:unnamed protein product [Symbiodinium pilosum]|uniref:RNA helicase n=1 Tax=Symbiodinium pilosum TaxID=2952 RepID=A0A812SNQ7_SYMPI|nr:unnamed protein product [Symbiodinium pilosum]